MKILLYCTKDKYKHLYDLTYVNNGETMFAVTQHNKYSLVPDNYLNGKIVAICDCEKVDFFEMEYHHNDNVLQGIYKYDEEDCEEWKVSIPTTFITNEYDDQEIVNCYLLKKSCLTFDDLGDYVCPKNGINEFYALHLSNIKIFDNPKELREYRKYIDSNCFYEVSTAPQNMMYVSDSECNLYVLLSIKPEHLVKILNGEKTIEVRRSILNCLK